MLDVALYNTQQHLQVRHTVGPISWYTSPTRPAHWQQELPGEAPQVSSRVEITPTEGGVRLRVEGCLATASHADQSAVVEPASSIELPLPAVVSVAGTRLEITAPRIANPLGDQLEPLHAASQGSSHRQPKGPSPATLARWLEALGKLHRWSAASAEFFSEAARFVVDPVGLDGAILLRRGATSQGNQWHIIGSCLPQPELGIAYEPELLDKLVLSPRTWFQPSTSLVTGRCESQRGVVVAPVLDEANQLIGAVYAFRAVHGGNTRRGIRHLEARLVQLLSESVSSGLARLDQEAQAAQRRATYQQVFAPSVVDRVELDCQSLRGTEREVTVLMADLRDFTSLCSDISTDAAYDLLNDVMDTLTAAVMEHDGVLIDYYGDGLSAMWNAPLTQRDHPELACHAALDMMAALPAVSHRWREVLPQPLRLGIGIHTGPAKVGNIGSSQRIKYGPRGTTVNLASRLESATKILGVPLVATRSVVERLSDHLLAYRLCQGQLPGIEQPVDLFGVRRATTDERVLSALHTYEQALEYYEKGDLPDACQLLHHRGVCDGVPAEFLVHQIQLDCARKLGRRAGDKASSQPCGTIELDVKG